MIIQFGDGKWGAKHQKVLQEYEEDYQIFDIDDDYKETLKWYIDKEPPEMVLITTSSVNHFPILSYCLENEIPVFCEKPVCLKEQQLNWLKGFLNIKSPMFMAGHQLCFDPRFQKLKCDGVNYINCQRTGAIPRDEGAVFSLAVHDIAVAQYVMDVESFQIKDISGNLHNAKIVLNSRDKIVEILVQSFANIKLRHMTLISDKGIMNISTDNWNRIDLLSAELHYFLNCVRGKVVPDINSLRRTIIVMETVFKINDAIKELHGA